MEQTITVGQLTRYIKQIFDSEELLYNISVVGEVSGFKIVRGIAYFELKDDSSLISCVCFNRESFSDTKNGDKIIAKGTPNFYAKSGKLNFNVNKISPYGIGELYKQFLELKDKLQKEGLFDERFKKLIPKNIKKLGVITSETGAVMHDIINVATRRNPAINICFFPAKVQGEGSAETIIEGLKFFEEDESVEVVIIARGGGSMEDLNEFNNEKLARFIFSCNKPIISAVGHETDFTICDFVSDVRAPTPSAGAEIAVENIVDKREAFKRQCALLDSYIDRLITDYKQKLNSQYSYLVGLIEDIVTENEYALNLKTSELQKFNPNNILKLGYSKIERHGDVITSSKILNKGDEIKIYFADGQVKGEIK